ncbi:restriction endonuclease subunit S, partial [Lacticaseibacillus paracasei]
AVRGSLGALGYVKDENIDWNINSQLAVIRTDKSELSGKFLVQFLLSWRGQKELLSRNTGTALKQLPIKQLKDVPVPIVNLDEQKEIGALFSSIDNLIAATQDKLSFLKKMKMFFLQQIFPTKNHDVPQIRFDGFTDVWSHYKLGSLMRIDKEQEVKKELLTDIQKGFY